MTFGVISFSVLLIPQQLSQPFTFNLIMPTIIIICADAYRKENRR